MNWIYFAKLFRTRFQAGCLAKGWSKMAGFMATMTQVLWKFIDPAKEDMGLDFCLENFYKFILDVDPFCTVYYLLSLFEYYF